jgi:ABC-2 type transport system ATP-binding protein
MFPVEISSLEKSYSSLKAVDRISFSVSEGEVFALLGPNGAGKTTTIEVLEGLRKRDGGEVRVLGLDPWRNGYELHRRIGIIPQGFTFFEKSTAREAIEYYSHLFGLKTDVTRILKEVLLEDSANILFENLSGGQKQKVGFALSLVNSPEVLFLDEPTSGLDPNARRNIWEVIEVLKNAGKTVILTTHYLDEAQRLSDRVAIMNHGHIVAMGTADQIIAEYGSGERLEIHGKRELADYIRTNTDLDVQYDNKGVVIVTLKNKTDVLTALATVKESMMEWGEIHTRIDSLDDVFIKLVREQSDISPQADSEANGGKIYSGRQS